MNHIPTPETDVWSGYGIGGLEVVPASRAKDPEIRLTIAREALETISRMTISHLYPYPDGPCIDRSDMEEVLTALKLTKPKL